MATYKPLGHSYYLIQRMVDGDRRDHYRLRVHCIDTYNIKEKEK